MRLSVDQQVAVRSVAPWPSGVIGPMSQVGIAGCRCRVGHMRSVAAERSRRPPLRRRHRWAPGLLEPWSITCATPTMHRHDSRESATCHTFRAQTLQLTSTQFVWRAMVISGTLVISDPTVGMPQCRSHHLNRPVGRSSDLRFRRLVSGAVGGLTIRPAGRHACASADQAAMVGLSRPSAVTGFRHPRWTARSLPGLIG